MANSATSKSATLRAIPSVDQLLRTREIAQLRSSVGIRRLTAIAREVIEEMRTQIRSAGESGLTKDALLAESVQRLTSLCQREELSSLRRVINATGVILHTNLGRAPLSEGARKSVAEQAAG
ncbi:MAG: L-seryl-tRNA(Sec) selenium transferase, partial [Acidobacteriota bacterium]|nr:L-seryl-tRNA(Sec) selenium transferase [Acidobacteriota bacterium]